MKLYREINKLDLEKEKYISDYIKKITKFEYVYLWGISESCDEAIKFFNKNKIKIKAIIDQNPDKYDYKYKNIEVIKKYVSADKGKILPRRITGACAKHQRHIATQVKYARHMALIPFVK